MQSFFPLLTEDLFLKENWIKIQRAAFQPGTKESFITNWTEAQKADVEIHSISTPDESDQVLVTAVLPEGGYTSGMPAQLFLSRKSETYQNCLPLTALRSDSGGDHVFVLRRQSSVLGTEWVIARVDITVKERDSQMMYVDGALTYSDQVVISSNKIISEGDRVRIEN